MDVRESDLGPIDWNGAAREVEPWTLRSPRHVLRTGLALFFLAVMVMVGTTSGPPLHPMHYWFIAAAFFAFHLLLAYMVDHVAVPLAFATAAGVSLTLVVSYLRLVTGMRQALLVAGSAQAVFLVLFSYAFFFEGFTGLTITVGAILTLFVLMQMTGRVSWDDVFDIGAGVAPAAIRASATKEHQ